MQDHSGINEARIKRNDNTRKTKLCTKRLRNNETGEGNSERNRICKTTRELMKRELKETIIRGRENTYKGIT